jgi:hypothetical protein
MYLGVSPPELVIEPQSVAPPESTNTYFAAGAEPIEIIQSKCKICSCENCKCDVCGCESSVSIPKDLEIPNTWFQSITRPTILNQDVFDDVENIGFEEEEHVEKNSDEAIDADDEEEYDDDENADYSDYDDDDNYD